VLWCVVVCCGVLRCVAVCYSVLQCVTYVDLQFFAVCQLSSHTFEFIGVLVRRSVLQCVAVCCSVLQLIASSRKFGVFYRNVVHCILLPCVAVWCSVLQCVAVCSCSVAVKD